MMPVRIHEVHDHRAIVSRAEEDKVGPERFPVAGGVSIGDGEGLFRSAGRITVPALEPGLLGLESTTLRSQSLRSMG